ncbi:MAG: FkbM family methyltransferase [Candidatus Babeliales bacterium]
MQHNYNCWLLSIVVCTTFTNTTYNNVEKLIKHYAKNPIKVFMNSSTVSNLGFGNCDSSQNGENLVIETFIRKNDIVLDVGAHIGLWSKAVLKATNNSCSIYSFEPVPDSYDVLKKLESPLVNRVFTFCCALGKEEKQTTMNYFFVRGSDCSTLFERPILSDVPVCKIIVDVTYLDKFSEENNIQHINFLKIDTEGAELNVIHGARKLLENNKIDIIQFEYGGTYPDANITLKEVYNYLLSHNYTLFRIVSNGLIHIAEWVESLENFQYSNYLALKNIA